jgi:hypothetical protein
MRWARSGASIVLSRPGTADRLSRPAQIQLTLLPPRTPVPWLKPLGCLRTRIFTTRRTLNSKIPGGGNNRITRGALSVPQQPAHTRGNNSLAVQTQSLPARPRSSSQALTPTIRVTTERPYTPESQAQPQDSHHTSAACLAEGLGWPPPAMDPHLSVVSG